MKQKIFSRLISYCKDPKKNLAQKEEGKKQELTTPAILTAPAILSTPNMLNVSTVIGNVVSTDTPLTFLPQIMPSTFYTGSSVGFVIDASISGIAYIRNILSEICSLENACIIMTSITINELDKLQHHVHYQGLDARRILAMAVKNSKSFRNVSINETVGNHDDCIISYCAHNKDWVVLFTADKAMALKAQMLGVRVVFFKHFKQSKNQAQPYEHYESSTLFASKFSNGKLYISCFDSYKRCIHVFSHNIEYSNCECKLQIGDSVFIATRKNNYLSFAHYEITSLSTDNNCKLIFYTRIHNVSQIHSLQNHLYKSFMLDFYCKQGS